MEEKKRRERKTEFAQDFDHRIVDHREKEEPEPNTDPSVVEAPIEKPEPVVQPAQNNSKGVSMLKNIKGSILGRISKSNGPAQSTPRQELQANSGKPLPQIAPSPSLKKNS